MNVRKIIKLSLATIILSSIGLPVSATTQGVATSEIPQQCERLFKEAEGLIAEAEKQPGTHTQLNKIKSKLNQSKKQILEMELATQLKTCDVGLAKLMSRQQNNDL